MAVRIERITHKSPYFAQLAAGMRSEDRVEAWAATGNSPAAALYLSLYCSGLSHVALDDSDYPLCAFGVCRAGDLNLIWLVGTDELEKHKRDLLTLSRLYLAEMLAKHGRLENVVDVRNRKSIRWLRWLGFSFSDEPLPVGTGGEPFYHFWKEGGEAECVP